MTNNSDDSMSSMNFNDSDIEKEFMQIKNSSIPSGQNVIKTEGSDKIPGGNISNVGNVANIGNIGNGVNGVGNVLGGAPGGNGRVGFFPNRPVGQSSFMGMGIGNRNGPVMGASVTNPKSPKPIPKGIDFGHELIGNPRFFSKNSTGLGISDEFQSSKEQEDDDDEQDFSAGADNSSENYRRMNPPQSFVNDAYVKNNSGGGGGDGRSTRDNESESIAQSSKGSGNRKEGQSEGASRFGGNGTGKSREGEVNFSKYQELTASEVYARKEEILIELEKLREKGVRLDREFTISSDLCDMERTYMRLKTKKDQTSAIKLMKKVLMGMVSGTEYVNQKFNKDNVDLEGWTEHVLINISDYDEIFEELYDKYKAKFAVAPEIKLLMTLFGSAFTFHMSKVLAKQFAPAQPASQQNFHDRDYVRPRQGNTRYENKEPVEQNAFQSLFATKSQGDNPAGTNINKSAFKRARNTSPHRDVQTKSTLGGDSKKTKFSSNLADIFGGDDRGSPSKGNDELDEIIREMESNQNNLSLPEDVEDTDEGYDEILSDSQGHDSLDLNEIQNANNLVL